MRRIEPKGRREGEVTGGAGYENARGRERGERSEMKVTPVMVMRREVWWCCGW